MRARDVEYISMKKRNSLSNGNRSAIPYQLIWPMGETEMQLNGRATLISIAKGNP